MSEPVIAIDFEAFWSKSGPDPCSLTNLGNWAYTKHPDNDIYALSIASSCGFRWCGHPTSFNFESLHNEILVAHNAGVELSMIEHLKDVGVIPRYVQPKALYDTADLTAYLGYPRSLKEASKYLLGKEVDKGVREATCGKQFYQMSPEFQKEVLDYCLSDSVTELELWMKHGHRWPEHERRISQMTLEMCWRGLPVNQEAIQEGIYTLDKKLWEVRKSIPWADDDSERKVLSPIAVAEECRRHGIAPPSSMAKDSQEFEEWLALYGAKFPWAEAMGTYRSANALLKKLQTMKQRTRPNGWMPYSLKVFGAHTGRDSGDSGFNAQNLTKGELWGVNLREMIEAPAGKTLGIIDLSQIEPRVLHWLAGDVRMLEFMRVSSDFYEAQARAMNMWSGDAPLRSDPKLRHLVKSLNLGLGFGLGAERFSKLANIPLQEAERLKTMYRSKNRPVTDLWKKLDREMRRSHGGEFCMDLPSGRTMKYRDVSTYGGLSAMIPRSGTMMRLKFHPGTLTENITQAVARDIFMDRCIELERVGYPILLRVHDEAVCLLNEPTAEQDLKNMETIMSTPPTWIPDIPLAAEGQLSRKYTK